MLWGGVCGVQGGGFTLEEGSWVNCGEIEGGVELGIPHPSPNLGGVGVT